MSEQKQPQSPASRLPATPPDYQPPTMRREEFREPDGRRLLLYHFERPAPEPAAEKEPPMDEVRFRVPDIHCDGCVATIRKTVEVLSGIGAVDADVLGRQVRIEYDAAQTSPAAIRERIERAGFDVGE